MIKHCVIITAAIATLFTFAHANEEGFQPLFDGKSLDGWNASPHKDSFKIVDGAIVAHGEASCAYYNGAVNGAKFKNFELRMDVMTKPSSNGGLFFHTKFQENVWPKAYEIQINNTQKDPRKTGGIYAFVDNLKPFEDNKWMAMVLRVENGVITSIVDGKEVVTLKPEGETSRLLAEGGTFAIQAHDPVSEVHHKNIRIKILD